MPSPSSLETQPLQNGNRNQTQIPKSAYSETKTSENTKGTYNSSSQKLSFYLSELRLSGSSQIVLQSQEQVPSSPQLCYLNQTCTKLISLLRTLKALPYPQIITVKRGDYVLNYYFSYSYTNITVTLKLEYYTYCFTVLFCFQLTRNLYRKPLEQYVSQIISDFFTGQYL